MSNEQNQSERQIQDSSNQPTIVQQLKIVSNRLDHAVQQREILIAEVNSQQIHNKKNQQVGQQLNLTQNEFFQVMDFIDQYDHKIKQINDLYSNGMLIIAGIKFTNPYTSLSSNGYKATPAITKFNIEEQSIKPANSNNQNRIKIKINKYMKESQSKMQNQQALHNIKSRLNFTYSSISQKCEDPQSFEDQQFLQEQKQIQEECSVKYNRLTQENFILERFSLQDSGKQQLQGIKECKNNFDSLLTKIVQLNELKQSINKKFAILEAKKKREN